MAEMTVIVEYETLEGAEPEFIRVITEHAQRTLQEEDGCLRFEVIKPVDKDGAQIPNMVMVDELYADQAALEAHNLNPRIESLRSRIGPLLKSRRLVVAKSLAERRVDHGIPPTELSAANDD